MWQLVGETLPGGLPEGLHYFGSGGLNCHDLWRLLVNDFLKLLLNYHV